MKNFLFLPLFTLLFLSTSWGQETISGKGKSDNDAQPSASGQSGLLWEVTGKGISEPSFLFGTIHLIDKENFFFPPGTLAAFDKAKKIVFEIDMAEMNDMSMLFSMMSSIMMSGGKSLSDLLSTEDYNLVKNHFTEMGLPFMMFERMKPMFLSIMTSMDMNPQSFSMEEMKSYELEFMEMATAQNKETGGLESIAFQMSVFDSIPYEAQAEMLVESIKGTGTNSQEQLDELIQLYRAQDIEKLQQTIGEEESGLGNYEDILLTKRNEAWIPKMKELMAAHCTFFAVGAGHLGGPNGVINLLRKEGYSLRPVKGN